MLGLLHRFATEYQRRGGGGGGGGGDDGGVCVCERESGAFVCVC